MYKSKYRKTFQFNKPSKSEESRFPSFSQRFPFYTRPRLRPLPEDRDCAFWVPLDEAACDDSRFSTSRHVAEEVESAQPEVLPREVQTKLHVKNIDLHVDENTENHNTEKYECTEARTRTINNKKEEMPAELVARRGQDFKMTIEFDRPYDIKKNDITLVFNLGKDYKPNKNLAANFKVNEDGKSPYKPTKWGATVIGKKGNNLTVNVFIPASAPIGEWAFSVRTIVDVKDGKDLIWQYNHNQEVNVLFNPWCKEDLVYQPDRKWIAESVENDNGALFRGSDRYIAAKPWYFGQYEDTVLDASFHLLRKSFGKASPSMANPVKVARQISKIINSIGDEGVLEGNWSGDYAGGTSPSTWGGSDKILRQYMDTRKPVKYGQCWVFSAVTTTVCRALGLPCISVTNFASAHNTDGRLSIDVYLKRQPDGSTYEVKDDSIWNFHVWNQVWMARPDLSEDGKYDGWQVIDATPQERSDDIFQCGPSPLIAVKEGDIHIGQDTPFVFAEVNADKVKWMDDLYGNTIQLSRKRNVVGKFISTHEPTGRAFKGSTTGNGSSASSKGMERLDLTNMYKYEEGSEMEKKTVKKGEAKFKMLCGGGLLDEEEKELADPPVDITIKDPGELSVGSGVKFDVQVKNMTNEAMAIKDIVIRVFYKTYFDTNAGVACTKKFKDIQLESREEKTYSAEVDERTCMAKPQNGYQFEVQAIVSMYDDMVCSEEFDFRFRIPDVEIKGSDRCRLSEEQDVELILTNPLSVALTECDISLAGGFTFRDGDYYLITEDIGPGKTWSKKFSIKPKPTPRKKKDRELNVNFDSRQLKDVTGYLSFEVTK